MVIKNLPHSERPRERCLSKGPCCLSLRELLTILIHTGPPGIGAPGVATALLERPGLGMKEPEQERALFTALEASASESALGGIPGLGPAAIARILAAFELGRRYSRQLRQTQSPNPRSPRLFRTAASRIPPERRQEPREWLGFVPLYRSGELGELCIVELGARTHVNVEPAELFARILALRPQGFFLFHNHPSDNLEPSMEDRQLTDAVHTLARSFGLRFLGHAVVGSRSENWIPML
ncbi:MAG: JAB domain-containing protein [Oligoflexia bacterium]|nr:JAB domain-containing protein [Oligoflexia bacterium]